MYGTKRKKKNLGGLLLSAGRGLTLPAKNLKLPLGLGVGVGTATSQMKPKNKTVTTGTNSISDAQKKAGGKTVRNAFRTAIQEAGRGRGAKPTKNIVTSKNGKAVIDKNSKIVTFGGKNKCGKKSRDGR